MSGCCDYSEFSAFSGLADRPLNDEKRKLEWLAAQDLNQIVLRFRSAVPKYQSQFVSVPEGIWNPGLSRLGASGFRTEN